MAGRTPRAGRRGTTAVLASGATAVLLALLPAAGATPAPGPLRTSSADQVRPDALLRSLSPSLPAALRESRGVATTGTALPGAEAVPVAATDVAELADGPRVFGVSASTGGSSPLAASGIPTTALDAYTRAADSASCGIDWTLVAAIGRVESNHGRFAGAVLHTDGLSTPPVVGIPLNGSGTALILDTDGGRFDRDAVHDRAVGPMQFIPSTWARYAADGNGDGVRDPFNIYDAARATAAYLCVAGRDLSTDAGRARAVFAYNHSDAYVATVLHLAAAYAGAPAPDVPTPDPVDQPAPASVPPADPAGPPAVDPPVPPVVEPPPLLPAAEPVVPEPVVPEPVVPEPVVPEPVVPEPVLPDQVPADPDPVPAPAPSPEPTPEPAPAPSPDACPGHAAPRTVDVLNGSSDPAAGDDVAAHLAAAGLTVGEVTIGAASSSGIEYPESRQSGARWLADALSTAGLLRVAEVQHVTVVLGPADSAALVRAVDALPDCG